MKALASLILTLALAASLPAAAFTTVDGAANAVDAIAQKLLARQDRRAFFAQIYVHTIRATAAKLARGEFRNPKWVERLIVNYATIYERTITRELNGKRALLPRAWRDEFDYIDRTHVWTPGDPDGFLWSPDLDVVYGIHVHITRDLVEALYVTTTDLTSSSLRGDFLLINEALQNAMPAIWNLYLGYEQQLHAGPQIAEPMMINWIIKMRAQAWDDAYRGRALTPTQKQQYLGQIDRQVAETSRRQGIFLLF